MKLDPRIIKGKKPLTAFDEMESRFVGTDCYFSDNARDYGDLSKCQIGTLLSRDGMTGVFNATKNNSYAFFEYCLPCDWVQEQNKKFRPYTFVEFSSKFIVGRPIKFRPKGEEGNERYLILNGYVHTQIKGQTFTCAYMGTYINTLEELFNEYEWYEDDTGCWKPFGIAEGTPEVKK